MPYTDRANENTLYGVGLMAKYWTPGSVKTRLGKEIGYQPAADVYKHFTLQLIQKLKKVAANQYVFTAPDPAVAKMQAAIGPAWYAVEQGSGDLGERMARALCFLLSKPGISGSILIGADLPTLAPHDLQIAFDMLTSHELVLGPAEDGGYYLIGLSAPWRNDYAELFNGIAWSTAEVYTQTMMIADRLGLSTGRLGVREDIDTLESLRRLLKSDSLNADLRNSISGVLQAAGFDSD